jgi:hypothetical protein
MISVSKKAMAEIVSEDRRYDEKFFNRFTKDEKSHIGFSEPVLVSWECERGVYDREQFVEVEGSADANDYFMFSDSHIFEDTWLYCEASFEGISKRVLIKETPTKYDLANWRSLADMLVA